MKDFQFLSRTSSLEVDKRVPLREQIQDLIEELPPLSCWSLHFTCAAGLCLCYELVTIVSHSSLF